MDIINAPQYYICSRNITAEQVVNVQNALRITPCFVALVSEHKDSELASNFCSEVRYAPTHITAYALHLAEESNRPILVIGDAEYLDAVLEDGTRYALLRNGELTF